MQHQIIPFPIQVSGGDIPRTGLLGEYLFEDNVNDTSGNNRHATSYNSPTYDAGKVGSKCLILDGIDQYVELPLLNAWEELKDVNFTCCIWVKTLDNSIAQSIIGNFGAVAEVAPIPNQWWQMTISNPSSTTKIQARRDNNAELIGTPAATEVIDGNWHFHLFEKSGVSFTYYVDNAVIGSAGFSQEGNTQNDQRVKIGVQYARFLNASFDALRLYNRVLTMEEKILLYNET